MKTPPKKEMKNPTDEARRQTNRPPFITIWVSLKRGIITMIDDRIGLRAVYTSDHYLQPFVTWFQVLLVECWIWNERALIAVPPIPPVDNGLAPKNIYFQRSPFPWNLHLALKSSRVRDSDQHPQLLVSWHRSGFLCNTKSLISGHKDMLSHEVTIINLFQIWNLVSSWCGKINPYLWCLFQIFTLAMMATDKLYPQCTHHGNQVQTAKHKNLVQEFWIILPPPPQAAKCRSLVGFGRLANLGLPKCCLSLRLLLW